MPGRATAMAMAVALSTGAVLAAPATAPAGVVAAGIAAGPVGAGPSTGARPSAPIEARRRADGSVTISRPTSAGGAGAGGATAGGVGGGGETGGGATAGGATAGGVGGGGADGAGPGVAGTVVRGSVSAVGGGSAGDVLAVSEDRPVVLDDGPPGTPAVAVGASGPAADPYRPAQWGLDVTSFEAARARSDGTGVVVAVIDTGVDAGHEDLAGRVLDGHHVLATADGGVDAGPGAADDHRHGTHVAGIIAALTGNGAGIAGAASGVRILPVKVLPAVGAGRLSDIAEGIVWAADHGAGVINLSLGMPLDRPDPVLQVALQYARGRDVVVVAAAGNSGCTVDGSGCLPVYPAADPTVLAVGALGTADPTTAAGAGRLPCAAFSTRGAYVDLAAPGSQILSTLLTPLTPPGYAPYATGSGTSMAAPHVAAAAALLRSAHPQLTAEQVVDLLVRTAADAAGAEPDPCRGRGLVDPLAALRAADAEAAGTAPPGATVPGPARLAGVVAGRGLVRVAFVAPAGARSVNVYRDGVLLASVPARSRGVTDRDAGPAVHGYSVAGVNGAGEGPRSTVGFGRAR